MQPVFFFPVPRSKLVATAPILTAAERITSSLTQLRRGRPPHRRHARSPPIYHFAGRGNPHLDRLATSGPWTRPDRCLTSASGPDHREDSCRRCPRKRPGNALLSATLRPPVPAPGPTAYMIEARSTETTCFRRPGHRRRTSAELLHGGRGSQIELCLPPAGLLASTRSRASLILRRASPLGERFVPAAAPGGRPARVP